MSGQPVAVLCHPHSKVPFHIHLEPPVLHFVSIASCSFAGHHAKETSCFLLTLSLQIFMPIDEVYPQSSLFQAKPAQFSQPVLL